MFHSFICCSVSFKICFVDFSDARYLVAGGKSRFLHLWALDTSKLIRVIEMPEKVKIIKQLEFLPDSYQKGVDQVSSCDERVLKCIYPLTAIRKRIQNQLSSCEKPVKYILNDSTT